MYSAKVEGEVRQSWNLGRFWSCCASSTSGTAVAGSALALALLPAFLIAATQPAQAQTETVLYSFTGAADGGYPQAGVIQDAQGNLYGTTTGGGNCLYCGVVFQLAPAGSETVLYSFTDGPPVAGLVRMGRVISMAQPLAVPLPVERCLR
jgi:uncharacterized repeat protein (TIGR03803 family)